jgi:hypothetical protein
MPIFYTDTASFNLLSVTGSTIMSGSSNATTLQLIGSGSTILSVSGSGGGIFSITDVAATDSTLFSVSTGSIDIFTVESLKNVRISGSLIVTGSITSSLQGTASFATSASMAISSSFATTASFALNAGGGSSNITIGDESITQGTATYLNFLGAGVTAAVSSNTASITIAGGGGGGTPGGANTTVQFNDSNAFSGSGNFTFNKTSNILQLTGSMNATSFTGSLQGTASFAISASYAPSSGGSSTQYLNFPVHTLNNASWADNITYYFGSTLSAADTTGNRNRGIFNRAGIIRSVYLYIRAAATSPSTEAITIRLRTATGTGTLSEVASTTFSWPGTSNQTVLNWTGLSTSVSANDTFEFQIVVPAMATNPANVLLAGNLLLELT